MGLRKACIPVALFLASAGAMPLAAQASFADDRAEIENLHSRYLFAFDWRDAETYAETFTEDGVLDYGAGEIKGRKAIAAFIEQGRLQGEEARAKTAAGERPSIGRHVISNIYVDVDGDQARGLAYWTHMKSGPDGYGTVDFFGHYEDELKKVDGKWLYARRRIYNQAIPEWAPQDANPLLNPSPPPRQRQQPRQ